jgi:hypothetical protein
MDARAKAEQHLQAIRSLMERATIYRAISAPTALVAGVLAVSASALILLRAEYATPDRCIVVWLGVLAITLLANFVLIWIGARRRGEPLFSSGMRMALLAVIPPVAAAAVLTIFARHGLQVALVWTLFYGLALLTTSHFAPRSLVMLGWAFLLSSLGALAATHSAPAELLRDHAQRIGALLMGVTFGLYHLLYAACTWPRGKSEAERMEQP